MIVLDGDGTESPGYPDDRGTDFRVVPDGLRLYLQPRHSAQIGLSSGQGLAGCKSATYQRRRLRIDDLPIGAHVCVSTGEGRFAELIVQEKSEPKYQSITLNYTIWDR